MKKDRIDLLSVRDKLIIALVNIVLIVSVEKGNYIMLAIFAVLCHSSDGAFQAGLQEASQKGSGCIPLSFICINIYPLCQ